MSRGSGLLEASRRPNPKTRGLASVCPGFLGPSWGGLGATWVVLDPQKIDAKIDQFFSASWNPIFGRFWWILGKKKWSQVGTQKRSKIEAAAIAEKPTKR